MRALLLHNPHATRASDALTARIADALSAGLKLEVAATARRRHGTALASAAVADGCDLVIALGGDGTVNEVLQAVAGTATRLAVLPAGSTNVFARTLGLPNDALASAAVVLDRVRDGVERSVGLGRVEGRWFSSSAGLGYDAEVVRMVDRRPALRRMARQATFVWCAALAQLKGSVRQAKLTVTADADPPVHDLSAVICCNANPYTYLGPLPAQLCPRARFDQGLDVTAFRSTGPVELLRVGLTAFSGTGVVGLPFVRTWHDRGRYVWTSSAPLPLHADGEFMGTHEQVECEAVPDAVTVIA